MASALQDLFSVILAGESQTYNDHNWYVGNKLKGYIQGVSTNRYSLLSKPLSEYTIGEVQKFQDHARDNVGQLWATGRYQIIPSTLDGLVTSLGLSKNDKYDQATQDKMGYQLLVERPAIKNYIQATNEDNKENLEKAALEVAKIWSSVGVPYATTGKYGRIEKNQSYYSGGGDRASEPTEKVQDSLRTLRQKRDNVFQDSKRGSSEKKNLTKTLFLVALITVAGYVLLTETKQGNKILALLK
jgi:hypothetical protein